MNQEPNAPKELDAMNPHILDFFENVGYLTHREVLDEMMVWNLFVWESCCYHLAVTKYASGTNLIANTRTCYQHDAIYREYEWLYHRMVIIDINENNYINPSHGTYSSHARQPSRLVTPDKASVKVFLEQEAAN